MIHFTYPWAFFLLLPLLVSYFIWARHGHAHWWRLLLIIIFIGALSSPHIKQGTGGSDVVLILDRSQSMSDSLEEQERIVQLVAEQREKHDRLAIIVVGAGAQIIQGPQHEGAGRLNDTHIEAYASDLRSGLEQAASLIPDNRSARIFIHSDGQYTNRDPNALAPQLRTRNIPVDVMLIRETAEADAAILDIELPMDLRLGQSFIGSVEFWSDVGEERAYTILRNNKVIAKGNVQLSAQRKSSINFADRPNQAGVASYTVRLDETNDRRPGNNKANAALRVEGGEQVLVMSGDGSPGNVHRALESAGLRVTSIAEGHVNIERLSGYKVLILDQVPANKLGHDSMAQIKTWVSKLGGGFVMLGGQRSYGAGGYHRSAIEDILPVTMELRDEHRKLSVAMAITLDRSGSMAAPVAGGLTKMDLANQGAIAAIELLGPMDAVAVHAVDSAPHIIVPMTSVDNADFIINKVRRIGSMGGGIYCYEALVAAGKELLTVQNQSARHLILFADAADAEQPSKYKTLLEDYQAAGITVSVIGLGTEADSDADFLKDIAKRGGGRVHFTQIPKDIPRLFAQETVLVARSAWINEKTQLTGQANLALLIGNNPIFEKAWPQTNGYNLCYVKPDAQQYAECKGDPEAPAISAWHIGNGRSIAVGFALDDPKNTQVLAWEGYAPLVSSLVRWCATSESQNLGLLRAQRFGDSLIVELQLDPQKRDKWPNVIPELELVSAKQSIADVQLQLEPIDDGRFEAHMQLERNHVFIPSLTLNKEALLGPAMCLPYSPEDRPLLEDRSVDLIKLSQLTQGKIRDDITDMYDNPPSPGASIDLSLYLIILGLLLFVVEIAIRRLHIQFFKTKNRSIETETSQSDQNASTDLATDTKEEIPETHEDAHLDRDTGLHEALRQLRKKR